MSRAPKHIVNDLGVKAAKDIEGRLHQTLGLLTDNRDRFVVSVFATAQVIGAATAFAERAYDSSDPAEIADFLMDEVLKPMVTRVLRGDRAEAIAEALWRKVG